MSRAAARPPASLVRAWQAALAAEHQAVFGYGLLGPRLPASRRSRARGDEAAHVEQRDTTAAALRAAGHEPVVAATDYPGLYPVPDATTALRLAVRLETSCAAAWRYLYLQAAKGPGASTLRGAAQAALTASAVRAARWRTDTDPGRASVAFPGV